MKRLLVLALLATFISGCAPRETVTLKRDAPAAQIAAGWHVHEANGYSVVVPDSYVVPEFGPGPSAADLQNMSNPATSYGFTEPQKSTTAAADIVLADKMHKWIPGEPMTGLTVNVATVGGGAVLKDEAKKAGEAFFKEEATDIQLPVGPAVLIKAKTGMVTGDKVWTMLYVICDGEKVYKLQFETCNGASAIETYAPAIADSFRVK